MGVKLTEIEIREIHVPFRMSYAHSLATRTEARSILVSVKTESGVTGWGEIIPREYLTGETIETAREYVLEHWWPMLRDFEANSFADAYRTLFPVYNEADHKRRTASYGGLEMAILDACGQEFNLPVRAFAYEACFEDQNFIYKKICRDKGTSPAPAFCTGPVGLKVLRRAKRLTKVFRLLRFRDIKLKTGFGDDIERISTIRKAMSSKQDLRVDANSGWSLDEALSLVQALRQNQVTSVEQPFGADNIAEMAAFKNESGIPVMADESLCNREDARILIKNNACDIFNVRLAKCGGFIGCLEMLKAAHENNMQCQIGVLVGETSILTAAGQELIAAIKPQRHYETSFPKVFLKNDPARGAQGAFWKGRIKHRPDNICGLGIKVNDKIIDKITARCDNLK